MSNLLAFHIFLASLETSHQSGRMVSSCWFQQLSPLGKLLDVKHNTASDATSWSVSFNHQPDKKRSQREKKKAWRPKKPSFKLQPQWIDMFPVTTLSLPASGEVCFPSLPALSTSWVWAWHSYKKQRLGGSYQFWPWPSMIGSMMCYNCSCVYASLKCQNSRCLWRPTANIIVVAPHCSGLIEIGRMRQPLDEKFFKASTRPPELLESFMLDVLMSACDSVLSSFANLLVFFVRKWMHHDLMTSSQSMSLKVNI